MKPQVEVVVKCGGGLLAQPTAFEAVARILTDAAVVRRLLIVPGGGPFADAVRDLDRRMTLSHDVAHWMAVRAMDTYSCLLAERLNGVVVTDPADVPQVLEEKRCPVLAPYDWLRREDPLPHSWEVTSDSIAAWVAVRLAAERLVLVKPAGACPTTNARAGVVDAYFARVQNPDIACFVVAADQLDALERAVLDVPPPGAPRGTLCTG